MQQNRACVLMFKFYYSGARKFVNPFEFSVYLHTFDLKCDHIFIYVLKRLKVDPV